MSGVKSLTAVVHVCYQVPTCYIWCLYRVKAGKSYLVLKVLYLKESRIYRSTRCLKSAASKRYLFIKFQMDSILVFNIIKLVYIAGDSKMYQYFVLFCFVYFLFSFFFSLQGCQI